MKRRRAVLQIGTAVTALAFSSVATAQETEAMCEDSRIRVQGKPDDRWLEPIVRACEELSKMADMDTSARVRIVPAGHELIVEVTLRDGRSTLRRVREPTTLKDTLEALLTLPPTPPAPPPNKEPRSRAEQESTPRSFERNDAAPASNAPTAVLPVFGADVGALVGGRLAGREMYVSVAPELFAQLHTVDWLFGMSARWDVLQDKSGGTTSFEMETIGAGFLAARRFHPGFVDIDAGFSPRFVSETQSFQSGSVEKADSQTDVRLGAVARVAFGHSAVRALVQLDIELSPGRLRRDIRIDPALPALPSWSAGVAAGFVWGQP